MLLPLTRPLDAAERRRMKRGLRSRLSDRAEDEKTTRAPGASASGGGGIFKSAAVAVLRQHRKLMTTGDITRLAVDMGLLKCQGKTPEATMASALYTDVKRKLQKSLFTRPQEGLFGLREWLEEGYYPEGWVGPPDGLGLAPFKRRNSASTHQGGGAGGVATPAKGKSTGAGADPVQVRTGPGRSSKARAARSWRSAASDEDEEGYEDDEETPRARRGAAAASSPLADDEDGDEAMGDVEDGDGDDLAEEDEEGEEGTEEGGREERRAGHAEAGPSGSEYGKEAVCTPTSTARLVLRQRTALRRETSGRRDIIAQHGAAGDWPEAAGRLRRT
ncbi:hypothetical protein TSOC_005511 [Tetrabaena socialis]|uniref:HTH HARE-type domain-containing protein n=1 Tax=Tetrabaena socialis TaxID=47790 RepID=A0A2J8A630_9CHLO|nr:hypothetical protein TSOC_005511 [Tetrabaena socialis]|eukprot:PNH07989.1 hypothetical protein TSOC_005511 [Tetrabaena socialis]